MQSIPLASIIIVTWNSAEHLSRCFSSLANQTYQDFEIILIDNGSVDGAINGISEKFPGLRIIQEELGMNKGFAAGNNIGVKLSRGQWVALLNADAFPDPDWLEQLLKAAEDNLEFTFFASRQIQANQPDLFDGEGDAYHFSGLAWRRSYNEPVTAPAEPYEVFSPCAAAALYRKDAFDAVGGFDEDYFSYFEDVDLGFRLRLFGARCLYVPAAVVHHIGSASTGKQSDFSIFYGYRNLIWTFYKNMPWPLVILYLPAHFMILFLTLMRYGLRGKIKLISKAIAAGLGGIPRSLKKRYLIQRSTRIKSTQLKKVLEYNRSILYRVLFKNKIGWSIKTMIRKSKELIQKG